MLTRSTLFALAIALVLPLAAAKTSQAFDGGCGYGYGYGIGLLYNSLEYRVPYFAAHPPVYYSYPVPRTYGYSPFAYPPNVMTPEIEGVAVPIQISNPFVPASETPADAKAADETVSSPAKAEASQPLVILNPYAVETSLARTGR